VREDDGLAMSSRNRYLSPEQRQHALALSRALRSVQAEVDSGETNAPVLRSVAGDVLENEPGLKIDHVEVVSPETLESIPSIDPRALVAVAAWVGETRLIDNLIVTPRRS
jgi:pantoate--beta-alanine ligase